MKPASAERHGGDHECYRCAVGQRSRWRGFARLLLDLAALLLVGAVVLGGGFGPRSLVTLLLPAIVFAVAATTFHPMPAPNDEGR